MLRVVATGAYYPPVATTRSIFAQNGERVKEFENYKNPEYQTIFVFGEKERVESIPPTMLMPSYPPIPRRSASIPLLMPLSSSFYKI